MYGYGQPAPHFGLDPISLSSLISAIRSAVEIPTAASTQTFRETYTRRMADRELDREIDREAWLASRPELSDYADVYENNRSRLFD